MVKAIQDKLDVEVATHCRTKAEMNKLHEEGTKNEGTITTLREVAQKKQAWYNKQLEHEHELTRDVKIRLNKEMSEHEELHERKSQIWAQMKTHYEEAAMANKQKIKNLKSKALEDL
mgnify:CR=1 FL=1